MNETEQVEYEIKCFKESLCPFGHRDVDVAVRHFMEAGKTGEDLYRAIEDYKDNTGTEKLENIDPCYVAYDVVLQEARNKISEILNFDFINDVKGGTEFYTSGNYCATSYDYSSEAQEQLTTKLKEATKEDLEELKEDKSTALFLSGVDIDIDEIIKEKEQEEE